MKKFILNFLILAALAGACIPIEDYLKPELEVSNKGQVELRDTDTVYVYNIGDTLKVVALVRDNERIDSITVTSDNPRLPLYRKHIPGGRLYRDTVRILIPGDAPVGTYRLRVTTVDYGGNKTSIQQFIRLQDKVLPVFIRVQPDPTLGGTVPVRDSGGNLLYYQTCAGNRLYLSGIISDNRQLSNFKVTISNTSGTVLSGDSLEFNNTRSIDIARLFQQNFRVNVPSVPDNTALQLRVSAKDIDGNTASASFNLRVECDITPPTLRDVELNLPGRDVVEGAPFRITGGIATDNQLIRNVFITIKKGNAIISRDSVFLNAAPPVNLGNALANRTFLLPDYVTERTGQDNEYVLFVEVDDRTSRSLPDTTLLRVVKDNAPVFDIARYEAFVDSESNRIDLTASVLTLSRGQKLYVRGIKTRDDYALDSVSTYWGSGNMLKKAIKVPVATTIYEIPQDVYEVPSTAVPGSVYTLRFVASDRKAKAGRPAEATEKKYTFIIR